MTFRLQRYVSSASGLELCDFSWTHICSAWFRVWLLQNVFVAFYSNRWLGALQMKALSSGWLMSLSSLWIETIYIFLSSLHSFVSLRFVVRRFWSDTKFLMQFMCASQNQSECYFIQTWQAELPWNGWRWHVTTIVLGYQQLTEISLQCFTH